MGCAFSRYALGTATLFLLLGCTERPESFSRSQIGLMPAGFVKAPVESQRDAAERVQQYVQRLGLKGLSVDSVRPWGGFYLVYVNEQDTGRGAFALQVTAAGEIAAKQFPGMEPEMMWNQKYGHRARRRGEAIEMPLGQEQARSKALHALRGETDLGLGTPKVYYGYYLFPLLDAGRVSGEAAVNAVDGKVVWRRFLDSSGHDLPSDVHRQ